MGKVMDENMKKQQDFMLENQKTVVSENIEENSMLLINQII